jgi:hypothetical protein
MAAVVTRISVGRTALCDRVSARLAAEFLKLPIGTVARCVADVQACAEHLGIVPTQNVVERVAREHLLAIVNSAPPTRSPR